MQDNDLIAVARRRCKTTNSRRGHIRYPNLIRVLAVTRPDEVWCADTTYIQVQREFVCLAIVMDLFTRSLRGWHLGRTLSSDLVLTALHNALLSGIPEIHLNYDTDQTACLWGTTLPLG
jgi:putative transposase